MLTRYGYHLLVTMLLRGVVEEKTVRPPVRGPLVRAYWGR